MSFLSAVTQKSNGKGIYYLCAKDTDGKPVWYYLRVNALKLAIFEKSLQKISDLADWGEILASGFGERSPNYFRRKMQEEYGFVHKSD